MNPIKLVGIALIVVSALGLAYGGFNYTKDSQDVKLGPLEFSIKEKETVNVPMWAGLGGVALGVVLLVAGGRKP